MEVEKERTREGLLRQELRRTIFSAWCPGNYTGRSHQAKIRGLQPNVVQTTYRQVIGELTGGVIVFDGRGGTIRVMGRPFYWL
nr:unnamed protein product [Digitaria exilis]